MAAPMLPPTLSIGIPDAMSRHLQLGLDGSDVSVREIQA
jgi:hypothetical protein